MWCFRRMQQMSWSAKKSNENVLRQIGQHPRSLKSIKIRQMSFLGHVIRKEKLEHLSLTGVIPGKRARGRQRQTYLQQFTKCPTTLIQGAYDIQAWRQSLLMRQSMSGPDRIQDNDDDVTENNIRPTKLHTIQRKRSTSLHLPRIYLFININYLVLMIS